MRTMPEISWDTFERYRQKGLDARRAGQWDSARVYLLEAARAIVSSARRRRAKSCGRRAGKRRGKPLEIARDWVKEKTKRRTPLSEKRKSRAGNGNTNADT